MTISIRPIPIDIPYDAVTVKRIGWNLVVVLLRNHQELVRFEVFMPEDSAFTIHSTGTLKGSLQ